MEVSAELHAPASFITGESTPPPVVPIVQEAGWAPKPVWTQWRREKFSAPEEKQTPVVQAVAWPLLAELPRLSDRVILQ
jgi:hypothetical protein